MRSGRLGCNPWHLATLEPIAGSGGFEYYGSGGYVPGGGAPGSVSQQIPVTAGQACILTFQTYFDGCDGRKEIDVSFGDSQSGFTGFTVTDCQFEDGKFNNNTATFVAKGSTADLQFSFIDEDYYTGCTSAMIVANGMFLSRALPSCNTQRG